MENKLLPSFIDTVPLTPKRGGKRPGAGRPASLANVTKKAEALTRRLQAAVKLGLSPLLDEYPELIKTAIGLAKGDGTHEPDPKLLMFLIALPLKMADLDELRTESMGDSILKEALAGRGNVNIQINNGRVDAVGRVPPVIIDATWTDADTRAGEGRDAGRAESAA